MTTTARNEFWPAIIEKAILKLYNCRDFKLNTNPSCEIFHLSGWIPEIIKFSEIPNKSQLFNKINSNFEDGNVLLCLGISENLFFPVIDFRVRETNNDIKVILPTSPFKVKDGRFHSEVLNPTSTSAFGDETGVKWLDWNTFVLGNFDTLYLSWNPSIYNFRFTFNSVWYKGRKDTLFWNQEYSVEYNPQFLIHIPPHAENLEIRIYLERFTDDFSSKRGISYKLFTYTATRVFHPADCLRSCTQNKRELYSDVFIFEGSERSEYYTLVVLKNDSDGTVWETAPEEVAFTLGVLSFYKIDVMEIPYNLAKQEAMISHNLQHTDFGGTFFNPSFLENPVYTIDVQKSMSYQFKVEFSDPVVKAMICLIGVDQNLTDIRQASYEYFEKQATPDKSNDGVSELNCLLEPGRYLMIISLENTNPVQSQMKGFIIAYDKDKSDHPQTVLKHQQQCFTVTKMDKHQIKQKLPTHKSLLGVWKDRTLSHNHHEMSRYIRKTHVCWSTLANTPGFILTFKEDGLFIFNLRSKGYEAYFVSNLHKNERPRGPPNLRISIFRILDLGNTEEVLDEQPAGSGSVAWGYWSKELRLPHCERGYLILCHTSVEAHADEFELQIFSNIKSGIETKKTEDFLKDFAEKRPEAGLWDEVTAGGSIADIGFEKNPCYEITVPAGHSESLFSLLCSTHGPVMSYLALIPCPKDHVAADWIAQQNLDQAIVARSSTSATEVLLHLISKPGMPTRWLLIPFLGRQGEKGTYTLTARTTAKDLLISRQSSQAVKSSYSYTLDTVPTKEPLSQRINNPSE